MFLLLLILGTAFPGERTLAFPVCGTLYFCPLSAPRTMPVSIMVLTSSFALISIVVLHHLAITKKTLSTDLFKDVYDSFSNDN